MVERIATGDIVHQQSAGRASVIRPGDRSESFLAGGVPYLQLDGFGLDGHQTCTEFDAWNQPNVKIKHRGGRLYKTFIVANRTDGQVVDGLESLVRELQQQTRFAHSCNICQLVIMRARVPCKKSNRLKKLTCVSDYDVFEQIRVGHGWIDSWLKLRIYRDGSKRDNTTEQSDRE